MIHKVNAPVKVLLKMDPDPKKTLPLRIYWAGRNYDIKKVTFHQTKFRGRNLYHEFFALSDELLFRLLINTSNFACILTEVTDDESD